MQAGRLNKIITFETKTVTKDPDYGSDVVSWTPVTPPVWAEVQDELPSKSEAVKQGIRLATQRARIRIRYRSGITSDMRIVIQGPTNRIMEIISGPAEIGRREGLEMMAEEYSS